MNRPNIVLITIDSIRADATGFLAEDSSVTTPHIDQLATDATLATEAITPSSHTRASVPALLTAQYSHRFFTSFLEDTDMPTIAQRLSELGYATGGFHSNPLLSRHFGYDRGFDAFYDGLRFVEGRDLPETVTRLYSKLARLLQRFPYEPAEEITQRATDWLAIADSPFFLWVHYMDPHGPYALDRERGYFDKFRSERLWHKAVSSPERITHKERNQLRQAYDSEVEYVDRYVGRLLDKVRSQSEMTRIVLTGDHGEEFGEHGDFTHNPKLYEELVQVPFILDLEDKRNTETTLNPISILDIVPTLLSNIDGLSLENAKGVDLHQAVHDGDNHRDHIIFETNPDNGEPMIGVRTDQWKYIQHGDATELYDLVEDSNEQKDRSGEGLDVEADLSEVLATHVAEHDITGGDKLAGRAAEMNDEMQNRLEDLGYL